MSDHIEESNSLVEELIDQLDKAEAKITAQADYIEKVRPYLTRFLHHMEDVASEASDGAVFWDLQEARRAIEGGPKQ